MYRLNISVKGKHFFRVEIEDTEEAKDVFQLLALKFPPEKGYKLTLTEWHTTGKELDLAHFLLT
jgi:hypothetical protein